MKFAMIPINRKEMSDGTHVRRVLIKYLFKTTRPLGNTGCKITSYHGTKIIDTDSYFKNQNSTHKYEFKDKYYKLLSVSDTNYNSTLYGLKPSVYKRRKYHTNIGADYPEAIELKCKSIKEAISKFNTREELK